MRGERSSSRSACAGGGHPSEIAQERVELQQDGLVRLSLKRAFADGTVAVDMDPLSLLCRLAASVPPPRFHTVKYAGGLASASPWRKRIGPRPAKPGSPATRRRRHGRARRTRPAFTPRPAGRARRARAGRGGAPGRRATAVATELESGSAAVVRAGVNVLSSTPRARAG
ncbi:transposase [Sorangium sp. So ce1036]|uniref:transposase n=1 Tax=Sorangium sp. So ce1036 TaxID=3133328 RepID=UPI003F5245BC